MSIFVSRSIQERTQHIWSTEPDCSKNIDSFMVLSQNSAISIIFILSYATRCSLSTSIFDSHFYLVDKKIMAQDFTTIRKRRCVVHVSITRLFTRLKDLETKADQPATLYLTRQMLQKLESLDSDFKLHHYALTNLINDTESMLKEQDILDGYDDEKDTLSTRIKRLIVVCDSSSEFGPHKIASQRLLRLGRNLFTVNKRIGSLSEGPEDVCLLRQYEEQLCDLEVELGDLCSVLLSLGIE